MNSIKRLVLASALAASFGAHASITGEIFTPAPGMTFLSLSSAGLPGVASLSGSGALYSASIPSIAAKPVGTVGDFLAAGTVGPATLTFGTGVSAVGFLWGSPDVYNQLTVSSTGGTELFTAMSLAFPTDNGNQSVSEYVEFTAGPGTVITGLTFGNTAAKNAFEVSNFSVTSAVPEPETYALLLAGLGAIGFVARRQSNR